MNRENVNTFLDDIAYKYEGLSQDESKALLTAIELTSYSTFHIISLKKKDLSRYPKESNEWFMAKAYNDGMQAVLNVINDCFPEEDEDDEEEAITDKADYSFFGAGARFV